MFSTLCNIDSEHRFVHAMIQIATAFFLVKET